MSRDNTKNDNFNIITTSFNRKIFKYDIIFLRR
nr:MAG TPA: hypothetical protein [Caudoviricetes sp.]DAX56325.1 MAG TPA: hypothetical protein [Caudoviricetes sp.]